MSEQNHIADWLDANVWDGDEVSKNKDSKHIANFGPHELYELVVELIEDIEKGEGYE